MIPGLQVVPNFITPEEEKDLIYVIDKQNWYGNGKEKRRVQEYGALYDYETHQVKKNTRSGLPDFLVPYVERISPYLSMPIDQAFVNEYVHHQGIGAHIDNPEDYGPEILSLSLGAPCVIIFAKPGEEPQHILVPPRALLIMSGEARYKWTHEIPYAKTVRWPVDQVFRRSKHYRRISITFRALRA
jgi:alkylated DNA repair dioxygenase AlkB